MTTKRKVKHIPIKYIVNSLSEVSNQEFMEHGWFMVPITYDEDSRAYGGGYYRWLNVKNTAKEE